MPLIKSKNALERQVKKLREQLERLKKEIRDRDKLVNDLLKVIDKYKEKNNETNDL